MKKNNTKDQWNQKLAFWKHKINLKIDTLLCQLTEKKGENSNK